MIRVNISEHKGYLLEEGEKRSLNDNAEGCRQPNAGSSEQEEETK